MSNQSTQRKLSKKQPPRVHISYDIEVGGAQQKKELPLIIGVLGQFCTEQKLLRDRQFIEVNKVNFNNVMKGMAPKLEMMVENKLSTEEGMLAVELNFATMDDFLPDNVAAQIEPLNQLLLLREQLKDLKNRASGNESFRNSLVELTKLPSNQNGELNGE